MKIKEPGCQCGSEKDESSNGDGGSRGCHVDALCRESGQLVEMGAMAGMQVFGEIWKKKKTMQNKH